MNRREFLTLAGGSVSVTIAGCTGSTDNSGTSNVDTGIVYEGDLSELRNWQVDVSQTQIVTVEASNIAEGELLRFQVGDGTGFVHTYEFYPDDSGTTNEYQFETNGQHQLQLSAERNEAPVNEDVTISVTMELSEPSTE